MPYGCSGGVRIDYFDYPEISHTFLLLVHPQSERENLSKAEIGELAKIVREIKDEHSIHHKWFLLKFLVPTGVPSRLGKADRTPPSGLRRGYYKFWMKGQR